MVKVIIVRDNWDIHTSPLDMPVLKQFEVEYYTDMFTSPGKIDKRKLPKLEGLRFQWYDVHRDYKVVGIRHIVKDVTVFIGMVGKDEYADDTMGASL